MIIRKLIDIFTESSKHFGEQEPGETVLLLLRPHRFTIFFPMGWILLFALIPLMIWIGGVSIFGVGGYQALFWFLTCLYYLALWIMLFYQLTIYSLNVVIVTDRRIIENNQYGFFNRKISELKAYRVQDISVSVKGLLQTFFNFGDVLVQTAGSEREFTFKNIGNPELVKDKIMAVVSAHQAKMGIN